MSILSVKVFGLFGYFDHEIPFHTQDRITILHGPNGVGKTTVLRLIKNIFSRNFLAVSRISFNKIVIEFSPKGVLTLTREKAPDGNEVPRISLIYRHGKEKAEYNWKPLEEKPLRRRYPFSIIEKLIDQLVQRQVLILG